MSAPKPPLEPTAESSPDLGTAPKPVPDWVQAMVDGLNKATAAVPATTPKTSPAFDHKATNDRRMDLAIAGLKSLSKPGK